MSFSKPFDARNPQQFIFPEAYNTKVVEANIISYSGPWWTRRLEINSNPVYDLNTYTNDYIQLGDPYPIFIPSNEIILHDTNPNEIELVLGFEKTSDDEDASEHNSIIYTLSRDLIISTEVLDKADGCSWRIALEGGGEKLIPPAEPIYDCEYSSSPVYDPKDAIQLAVYNLLTLLDLDEDGEVDIDFDEQNLNIDSFETEGIPFAETIIVQVSV